MQLYPSNIKNSILSEYLSIRNSFKTNQLLLQRKYRDTLDAFKRRLRWKNAKRAKKANSEIDFNLLFRGIGASLISFFIFETFRKFAKYIYKKDAIGKGDSKLVAMIGLWLGPIGIILCIFFSYVFAAVFCLLGISLNIIKLKQNIPFAPFLSLGGLIVWLKGNQFIINKLFN